MQLKVIKDKIEITYDYRVHSRDPFSGWEEDVTEKRTIYLGLREAEQLHSNLGRMIPNLREFQEALNKEQEAKERDEYERLKKKYG